MKKLIDEPERDAEGVEYDAFNDSVHAMRFSGADRPFRFIDPAAQKRYAALGRTFPDRISISKAAPPTTSASSSKSTERPHPPLYYLVDFAAKSADIVGEQYPGLVDKPQGAVRRFEYAARDKYALFGYLTIPPGAEEKNLPLVVLPHGGPESDDTPYFDWWSQFLASRGYAVLRPQFRGSTGLGDAHRFAGRGQWGLRMQDDVTDGVQALIAQGIADPKRVCYRRRELWRLCGAGGRRIHSGSVRLRGERCGRIRSARDSGVEREDVQRESDSFFYWRDSIGDSLDSRIAEKSPARSARTIRAPILLLHGTNDSVVPFAQSEMMANALKAAGKPYQLMTLEGEDHWLSSSATRIRMLSEIEKFLAANLASKPAN